MSLKISIITVSFNSDATIEDTIKSIEGQSYKNIEYLIIDGLSSDNTLSIANKYPHVVTKIISEKDNGLYDAMNKGITMATGDVVGILNSDDLFCDEFAVEKVMRIFNINPALDSVYADIFYVRKDNTDNVVRKWVSGEQKPFKKGWHPAHPTFYVKKHVYEKCGVFNLNYKLAADFELMLRFLEKYKISTYYLPSPLIKMRLGGETNKSFKNIINQNIECLRAFEENDISVNKLFYPLFRIIPKFLQYLK